MCQASLEIMSVIVHAKMQVIQFLANDRKCTKKSYLVRIDDYLTDYNYYWLFPIVTLAGTCKI